MAFQTVTPFAYPDFRAGQFAPVDGGIVIDAADEQVAYITQAPVTDTLASVHVRVRNHTSPAILEVRLETVTGMVGTPSGTLLAAGAEGTIVTSGVGDYEAVIDTPPSLTRGDVYAIVVKQPSSGAGNCAIGGMSSNSVTSFPYVLQDIGGAGWVRNSTFDYLCVVPEWTTNGIVPGEGNYLFIGDQALSINTGTDPDERGNKFILPVPVRVTGCVLRNTTVTGSLVLTLYDGDDNELTTITVFANVIRSAGNVITTVRFPEAVELEADATYRLTYQSDSTSNVGLIQSLMETSGNLDAFIPNGYVISTWRTNGGAWTDSDLGLVYLGLLIDGVGDGESAGGGGSGGRIIGATA